MTSPQGPQGPQRPEDAEGPRGKAAELLAAVRAVESGEREAAEFFAAPKPPPASRRPAAPADPSGAPGAAPTPPGGAPQLAPSELRALLERAGAPGELADAVVARLGAQAAEVLRSDPWQLLSVPGVGPEQADSFARALPDAGFGPDEPLRSRALVEWLLERAARAGHTVLEAPELASALARYAVDAPDEAVRDAVESGAALVFREPPEAPSGPSAPNGAASEAEGEDAGEPTRLLLGLDRWALAEESLADGVQRLLDTLGTATSDVSSGPGAEAPGSGTPGGAGAAGENAGGGAPGAGAENAPPASPAPPASAVDWDAAAEEAARSVSPSAGELIRAAAASGVVVHTGGERARAEPAALVAAARAMGLRGLLAVHTEDGLRRVPAPSAGASVPPAPSGADAPDGTDTIGAGGSVPAVTVAGLLSGREGPERDAEGGWPIDVLAVLDAPQLDSEAAAALVESLPDGARLVLSGDPQLLGAAGAGQVLADLAASGVCPQVVSRTPDPGPLGELVSGVAVGALLQVEAPGKELVIVPVREAEEAVHRAVQLVTDSVPRAFGVPPEGAQVITPGHAGAAGTLALNAALKERLNPGPGRFGGFDLGDRVVHSAVPGRCLPGTVAAADDSGLRVESPAGAFTVPRDAVAATLRHGWALTAHQAAGRRWPAVVAVLPPEAARALDRAWVHTAFSRAERHLSVVQGIDQALPRAVAERPGTPRRTRLRELLRERRQGTAGAGQDASRSEERGAVPPV